MKKSELTIVFVCASSMRGGSRDRRFCVNGAITDTLTLLFFCSGVFAGYRGDVLPDLTYS